MDAEGVAGLAETEKREDNADNDHQADQIDDSIHDTLPCAF
jgi:hypothetical protein